MSDVAVDLLSSYIRLDTSNPPGNEHLAAEFFRKILESEKIPYKTYEKETGRVSIRAEVKGSGKKKPVIMLHHMDVIAASREEWSFDPFGGELIDGYICGRGALDTKSLGIMQLLALIDLKRSGAKPDCDLIFLATADEESGADCGVEFLLRDHADDFQAGLVLNEGSNVVSGVIPDRVIAMISPAEKGPCWMRLKRKGIPGHGSTPHGQNPLEKMTAAVNRLLEHAQPYTVTPIVAEYFNKMAAGLEFLQPYAVDGNAETLLRILKTTGLIAVPQINAMLRNTISLNSMHSGNKVNVIPSYAEADIDTRLLPGQGVEDWINLVTSLLADKEIEIEFIMKGEGNASDHNTDSYRTIEKALQDHYPGCIAAPYLMLGTTDSRFFRERGTLSYGFSPAVIPSDHVKTVHGIDEKIAAKSMIKWTEVYTDVIRRLCTQ
jgi:acetylornithine deacetylase/succinyl-diaminopimelate desuccinylase-like protein